MRCWLWGWITGARIDRRARMELKIREQVFQEEYDRRERQYAAERAAARRSRR